MNGNFEVTKARPDEPELEQPPSAGVVPKVHFRWILSGPSRSGKTNLARWSLDNHYGKGAKKSWFDRVILLSPTAKIDWTWAGLPGLKDKDRIIDPTPQFLSKLLRDMRREIQGGANGSSADESAMKRMAERRKKAKKVLVIFDDAIAESGLINSPEFLKIFIQGRHYNISSMVMSQSYMKIPRSVRLQATHLSMFPSRSTEIDRIWQEHGPKELSKKEFYELATYATTPLHDQDYPFMYVDSTAPVNRRFRRNYTEVLEIGGGGEDANLAEAASGGGQEDEVSDNLPPDAPPTQPQNGKAPSKKRKPRKPRKTPYKRG